MQDNPDRLIQGADDIAEFLFGDRKYARRVYYLAQKKALPLFILGGRLTGRERTLRAALDQLEQGGLADVEAA